MAGNARQRAFTRDQHAPAAQAFTCSRVPQTSRTFIRAWLQICQGPHLRCGVGEQPCTGAKPEGPAIPTGSPGRRQLWPNAVCTINTLQGRYAVLAVCACTSCAMRRLLAHYSTIANAMHAAQAAACACPYVCRMHAGCMCCAGSAMCSLLSQARLCLYVG